MLRDDRQVALDQVIEALQEAGNAHEQGAARLDAACDLARALQELAARRRRATAELIDHGRRLGDLPSEPDADRQTAKDALARLQLALASDERDRVLQHCRQAEEHLAETIQAALKEDLPSDTRAALENLLSVPELGAALGS